MLKRTQGGMELLADYEDELYDLEGRPHWGQVNTLTPGRRPRALPRARRVAGGPRPAQRERRLRQRVLQARRDPAGRRRAGRERPRRCRTRSGAPCPAHPLAIRSACGRAPGRSATRSCARGGRPWRDGRRGGHRVLLRGTAAACWHSGCCWGCSRRRGFALAARRAAAGRRAAGGRPAARHRGAADPRRGDDRLAARPPARRRHGGDAGRADVLVRPEWPQLGGRSSARSQPPETPERAQAAALDLARRRGARGRAGAGGRLLLPPGDSLEARGGLAAYLFALAVVLLGVSIAAAARRLLALDRADAGRGADGARGGAARDVGGAAARRRCPVGHHRECARGARRRRAADRRSSSTRGPG